MTSNEAVLKMIAALEAAEIPYLLAGSYSSNVYGVARSTQDADFVIRLTSEKLRKFLAELPSSMRLEPQMSFESVTMTARYIVQVAGTRFKMELFLVGDDPHDLERFARRRQTALLGRPAYLPTPEDIVITKLRWSQLGKRRKDVDDVRNVIAVQRDRLDWDYIYRWCEQHGTRALLDEIRRSIPAD
jgi:hypothetical protein